MDGPSSAGGFAEWIWLGGAGLLGRLMYHAKQVQQGKRKPFSWVLAWDAPIALAMGWIALGISTYFHTAWPVSVSIALVCAYLGPYSIDTLFASWAVKKVKD